MGRKLMNARKPKKRYWEMNLEELREATKEFDRPNPRSKIRPLSKRQRARFERLRNSKPDVSIYVHRNHRDVIIHLEDELLGRAAVYARKHKTSLPKMIDRGLRGLLAFDG
jgi:hypothetical protein